jgi:hypothetical protein
MLSPDAVELLANLQRRGFQLRTSGGKLLVSPFVSVRLTALRRQGWVTGARSAGRPRNAQRALVS